MSRFCSFGHLARKIHYNFTRDLFRTYKETKRVPSVSGKDLFLVVTTGVGRRRGPPGRPRSPLCREHIYTECKEKRKSSDS